MKKKSATEILAPVSLDSEEVKMLPVLSIELNSPSLTFNPGEKLSGFVHCNLAGAPEDLTKNTTITLEFEGVEKTKWEV